MSATDYDFKTEVEWKYGIFTPYSVTKAFEKNEIIKFAGEWVKLETIIWSEVTQAKKGKCSMFSFFIDANFESSAMCVSFGIPTEVRKLLKDYIGDFRVMGVRKQ